MTDTLIAITLAVGVVSLLLILTAVAKVIDAVNGINRKLELLMKHSGMNVYELAAREAQALMREGKKIEAIKVYRGLTGAGLAEAKAAVERLEGGAGTA